MERSPGLLEGSSGLRWFRAQGGRPDGPQVDGRGVRLPQDDFWGAVPARHHIRRHLLAQHRWRASAALAVLIALQALRVHLSRSLLETLRVALRTTGLGG